MGIVLSLITLAALTVVGVGSIFVKNGRLFRRILCVLVMFALLWGIANNAAYKKAAGIDILADENVNSTEQNIIRERPDMFYDEVNGSWVNITSVITSSDLSENRSGIKMIDDDYSTSWQEGAEGFGEGSCFSLTWDEPVCDGYIVIFNGNQESEASFWNNGRVCQLLIQDGYGNEWTVQLEDTMEPNILEIKDINDCYGLDFSIVSVYSAGATYEDTCITEIAIYRGE